VILANLKKPDVVMQEADGGGAMGQKEEAQVGRRGLPLREVPGGVGGG
jgi:hypothetical protein